MAKQVAVNFTASAGAVGSPEYAVRSVTDRINEYLQANPNSSVVSVSHSVTGRVGPLERGDIVAHAIVVFSQS